MPTEITNAIMQIGLPSIMCYVMWKYIQKKDEDNERKRLEDREYFKEEIKTLRVENKEEKEMFKSAINLFNQSVNEFKTVKNDVENVDKKVDSVINMIEQK